MIKMLPLYIILAIIGAVAFYVGFTGKKLWFISDTRTAVIVLTVLGLIMCSLGNLGVFINQAPAHPLTIAGYLLGTLALFAGIVQIFKWKVPFLADPYIALIVIAVVIVLKFTIARLSFLLPGN